MAKIIGVKELMRKISKFLDKHKDFRFDPGVGSDYTAISTYVIGAEHPLITTEYLLDSYFQERLRMCAVCDEIPSLKLIENNKDGFRGYYSTCECGMYEMRIAIPIAIPWDSDSAKVKEAYNNKSYDRIGFIVRPITWSIKTGMEVQRKDAIEETKRMMADLGCQPFLTAIKEAKEDKGLKLIFADYLDNDRYGEFPLNAKGIREMCK